MNQSMAIDKKTGQEHSNRDFHLMVLGQIISILGSALLRFALSLYVLDMTGRADLFATLFAISNVPMLLTPIGGAIADRFNRRNLMVIYDFCSSFVVFALFFVMARGQVSVFVIGAVMVVLAVISAMYTPSVNASVPLLVHKDKIESANGIVTAVQALSGVAAPVLGGILYKIVGVNALVIVSAVAFFLSAVMEIFIRIPFEKRELSSNIVKTIGSDMKDGFRYIIKQSFILKAMILAALINLVLSPLVLVGAPVILRVTMQSTDLMYGIGMGLINFASILGALAIGAVSKKVKIKTLHRLIIMAALLLIPVALAVTPFVVNMGYYPSFILFMVGIIPMSMVMTILSIYVISKVQKITPNENLGKVMAIIIAVAQCMAPIGQAIYGVVFESFQGNIYLPIMIVIGLLLAMAVFGKTILRNEKEVD